jgi:hypothetical protein
MTVSTQLSKITYNGDGSTTQWTFSFPGHDTGAIIVYITDNSGNVIQLSTLNYSVTLNPAIQPNPTSIGGVVIYPLSGPPLAVGNKLTIRRLLPIIQQTSLSNQSIIYPPVVETDDDYLTLVDQQLQEQISRSIMVNVSDPAPAPLPPLALRANQQAFFDANGNLTAGQFAGTGVVISAAMQPVVSAATIKAAQIAFGLGPFGYGALNGNKIFLSGAFTVSNGQKGMTFLLAGGALYTLTIPPANASIDDDFQILIFVNDSRGKKISVPGYTNPFMLWPNQWMLISKYSGTWLVTMPPRWRPGAPVTFYVNPTTGADTNDGLARGSGAFQTIQGAVNAVQQFTDGQFQIVPESGAFSHPVGSGVVLDGLQFNRSVTIVGDGPVSPPGVGVYCDTGGVVFTAKNGAILGLQNLYISLTSPGSDGEGILCENGSVLNLFNCSFGGFNGPHMEVFENATMNIGGFYDIYGGATVHLYAHGSGYVTYGPTTAVGFTTAVNIGTFMEAVFNSSIIFTPGITFSNPSFCTGDQVFVDYNSTIVTQGATIPGTTPGTIGTHGGYVV